MNPDFESEFIAINKRLATMQEFLDEIHRIVLDLHQMWNTPSNMEIPEEALKEKEPPPFDISVPGAPKHL